MSNKVALEDRNALAEADALLAEDDGHELQSARRNHDGDDDAFKADLQRLEEEENLPAPVQANQTSAVRRARSSDLSRGIARHFLAWHAWRTDLVATG